MVSERKFPCAFGYTDACPVRALLAKEQREAETIMKSVSPTYNFGKDVSEKVAKDLTVFLTAMMAPIREMVRGLGRLREVANFCAACPIAIKGKAQAIEEYNKDVEARAKAGNP